MRRLLCLAMRVQLLAQGAQAGFLDFGSIREGEGVEALGMIVIRVIPHP